MDGVGSACGGGDGWGIGGGVVLLMVLCGGSVFLVAYGL